MTPVLRAAYGAAVLFAAAAPLAADDHAAKLGDLTLSDAWARAAMREGGASAAYLTVETRGEADRLVAAASSAAARVELHEHILEDGVAKMREVAAGVPVEPGAPAVLEPGGYHVMLMGLSAPLAEGDAIDLTLTFETSGEITLTVPVRAMAAGHGGHGG